MDLYTVTKRDYTTLQEIEKHVGGFYLADERPNGLMEIVIRVLEKYKHMYDLPFAKNAKPSMKNFTDLLGIQKDPDYQRVYDELIGLYKINVPYATKNIYDPGKKNPKKRPVYPHHLNFAACMFISYLTELELFALLHTTIPYNYIDENGTLVQKNRMESLDYESKQHGAQRAYHFETTDVVQLLKNFASKIDDLFAMFVDKLVNVLSTRINIDVVTIRQIVLEEKPKNNDYHVRVDWKERIMNKYNLTIDNIKVIMEKTMNDFRGTYTTYYADGTGYFALMHLIPPDAKKGMIYGSCITLSQFELYFMIRLHVDPNEVKLVLQTEHSDKAHFYWRYVQSSLKKYDPSFYSISHWATEFYDQNPIRFRFFDPPDMETSGRLSFGRNKVEFFKASIYQNYDAFNHYLDENKNTVNKNVDSDIVRFINDRIQYFENSFEKPVHREELYEYGFIFILKGNQQTTVYDQKIMEILNFAEQRGDAQARVKHRVKGGPRAGTKDVHIIDFKNNTVTNTGTNKTYTLYRNPINIKNQNRYAFEFITRDGKGRTEYGPIQNYIISRADRDRHITGDDTVVVEHEVRQGRYTNTIDTHSIDLLTTEITNLTRTIAGGKPIKYTLVRL